MNLHLTQDQRMLRESVAKLLTQESSPARVRAAESSGFDLALWRQLHATGIVSMRVPEQAGGSGMGLFDAVLVAEEAGAHLASVPLAEALPALRLLSAIEGAAATRLLATALDGAIVTLLPHEWNGEDPVVSACPSGGTVLVLRGDFLLAVTPDASAPRCGLGSECLVVLQPGQGYVLASGATTRDAGLAAIEEWKLLKAAMLSGLARHAMEMAAAYASQRIQFGKPIGSFQGIAHPLADALAEVDGARLLVWHAVWAIASEQDDAGALVSMAWWWATQSSARIVARALHTFGGYGVSLEYDIQLYYRRGKSWALLAGDPQLALSDVADRLWNPSGRVVLPDAGEVSVEFGVGASARAFEGEVRRFFIDNMDDAMKAHAHHSVAGYHQAFHQKLARAGLLFPHWPAAWGGSGRSAFDMAALAEVFEEFNWQRVTGPVTNQVAQIVMAFATDEAKQEALPRFASGEALACLGFSEPAAGSDVFAAQTRAERDGDGWIINGQKIFTTAANLADYILLLVRTDPNVPKHAGLTMFLVPMDTPGIEIQAVHTVQDERTNITYLSEVRVPDRYRIGAVDGGLAVMAATLELEHGGDQYRISFSNMVSHAVAWARSERRAGKPAIANDDTRRRLARATVLATIARDLCYRSIWATEQRVAGRAAFGPMSKLFSTEHYQQCAADLMDLAAPASLFAGNAGLGHVEIGYRQSIGMTIYGGTSEVHRSLVAEQGLGMPRSRT
jgi:alkylation response protein AidB-like acyl-CoA dehydrogenase